MYDQKVAADAFILYGGSVNLENAADIARQKDVNGLFIGRAGLDAASFAEIILRVSALLQEEAR